MHKTHLMPYHGVFLLICEHRLEDRECGGVLHLSKTVRKLMLQERTVVQESYITKRSAVIL